jgi:threonylcarbamoyladenosine tRNA methylthiotransferase MtaB
MSAVEVVTFGCRLNAYESEVMRRHAAAGGLEGDIIIVNTCAVTAEAERQARQAIRRLRRERPTARIVVTGCGAQIDPGAYAAMAEVDRVVGNAEKMRPETWTASAYGERVAVGDIMAARDLAPRPVVGMAGRARAFLEIQQGCDHRCTFCTIPLGRGRSRSLPLADVFAQARELVAAGHREIVLTGVDLTAYGLDLPEKPTLGDAVRGLLAAAPELTRLRLSSLDPVEVDEELVRAIAEEPRLMPHLHLSLQSGDDLILKRMLRRHSRAQAVEFCARLRRLRPDLVFGADLIAGFPTETEAAFANSLALIEDCGLTWLHVFPYSARAHTPAARMPQVPLKVRRERAARLRGAGDSAAAAWLQGRVGTTAEVLVEKAASGRDSHYAPVDLDRECPPGAVVAARILGTGKGRLSARVGT